VQNLREPKRSVQNTEFVDNLTVVDREDLERQTRYVQDQPLVARKPEVSVHTVDDVYLQVNWHYRLILHAFYHRIKLYKFFRNLNLKQTIVERRLIEDEERRTRDVAQFYKKEQPKWDVVIRRTAIPEDEAWERGELKIK